MDWYYADEGKPVGPLSEADFRALVTTGTIGPSTMIWREGMSAWLPFSNMPIPAPIRPEPVPESPAASSMDPALAAAPAGPQTPESPVASQTTAHTERGAALVYASMGSRFVAKFVDGVFLYVLFAIMPLPVCKFLDYPFSQFLSDLNDMNNAKASQATLESIVSVYALTFALWFVAAFAASVFFVGRFGATPGKLALRLRIVRSDGSALSYGRAAGMFFAEILDIFVLGLGYLMANGDPERRTLRDRICDTRVIRKL